MPTQSLTLPSRNDGVGLSSNLEDEQQQESQRNAYQESVEASQPAPTEAPSAYAPTIELIRWHILRTLAEEKFANAQRMRLVLELILMSLDDSSRGRLAKELAQPIVMPDLDSSIRCLTMHSTTRTHWLYNDLWQLCISMYFAHLIISNQWNTSLLDITYHSAS